MAQANCRLVSLLLKMNNKNHNGIQGHCYTVISGHCSESTMSCHCWKCIPTMTMQQTNHQDRPVQCSFQLLKCEKCLMMVVVAVIVVTIIITGITIMTAIIISPYLQCLCLPSSLFTSVFLPKFLYTFLNSPQHLILMNMRWICPKALPIYKILWHC